jgi:hypothetical protein
MLVIGTVCLGIADLLGVGMYASTTKQHHKTKNSENTNARYDLLTPGFEFKISFLIDNELLSLVLV